MHTIDYRKIIVHSLKFSFFTVTQIRRNLTGLPFYPPKHALTPNQLTLSLAHLDNRLFYDIPHTQTKLQTQLSPKCPCGDKKEGSTVFCPAKYRKCSSLTCIPTSNAWNSSLYLQPPLCSQNYLPQYLNSLFLNRVI